jgi:hypothetical protein
MNGEYDSGGFTGENKMLENLLVHHKSHVNWPGIETWLFEFHLLHLCFYICVLCIYVLMCMCMY